MATAQAQYLQLIDNTNTTVLRWQSYYAGATVSWQGANWQFIPFEASGMTSGISGAEASITVVAPATPPVVVGVNDAIARGLLAELSIYQFDPTIDNNTPQNNQTQVALFLGQVVGGSATLTTMTFQLGSALSPVGVQIPPLKLTTQLMGIGIHQ